VKVGFFTGLFALFVFGVSVGDAFAQSTRDLSNRLNRLENEVQTLNRSVYKGQKPPLSAGGSGGSGNSAAQEIRIQQLETELRDLTGQIEEQNFKIRQMEETLEKANADFVLRLEDLERGRGGAGAGGSSSASQYIAPRAEAGDGYQWQSNNSVEVNANIVGGNGVDQPAAVYENAFALLKNKKFVAAERGFKDFGENYPDHVLAGNAKYWLGESYYVRGKYDEAVRVFAEGYQQYPKSAKAPDNLLKLGMSLAGLKKKDDACIALEQLRNEYSESGNLCLSRFYLMNLMGF